jgi:hypothetical protein
MAHTPSRDTLLRLEIASARRANNTLVQMKRAGHAEVYLSQARAMRLACMTAARSLRLVTP